MPDVISNTTPLQYLHQIGRLDLLPNLYQHVIVPKAVVDELRQGKLNGIDVPALDSVAWVTVESVGPADLQRVHPSLDAGEREAIAPAIGKSDPLLILDDAAARSHAKSQGIPFTGTVGILVRAKQAGLISAVGPCMDQLDRAGFYLDASVCARVLNLAGEAP